MLGKRQICVVFLLWAVCWGHAHRLHHHHHKGPQQPQFPTTVTPSGVIKGSWMQSWHGRRFEAYQGIRYAEPPVGELRFEPPRLILKYDSLVDASQEGPACPLPIENYYIDEDCLRLNVYTPRTKRSKPLPVIVFIHAGGFYSMTGRSDVVGPHYLMDRDVVLVGINYRLASLGFISTGDELAPGNNGMKDQVMALRWVQRNIAAFGGDPNLVTIAGCSAGSISVMLHMISPMSKGLFHRAISMSGSPTAKVPSMHDMLPLAEKQARLVGCPTNNTRVIIDCLKTVPWRTIGNSLTQFFEFGIDPTGIWFPNVEPDFGQERFLPIEPMDAIREGKMHPVPYIISQTEDEFFWDALNVLRNDTLRTTMNNEWERIAPISFILPRDNSTEQVRRLREYYIGNSELTNTRKVADGLGKLYGDALIGFNVHRLAKLMTRHSTQPVYFYLFSYLGNHSFYEDPVTGKPTGVAHHDDMIYLLTLSFQFPTIPIDSPDADMVKKMTAIWLNFARHGDPNPRGDLPELKQLNWPRMTPENREYLRITSQFSLGQDLFQDRYNFWEELYPIQY